jgi:hypothetical protein
MTFDETWEQYEERIKKSLELGDCEPLEAAKLMAQTFFTHGEIHGEYKILKQQNEVDA